MYSLQAPTVKSDSTLQIYWRRVITPFEEWFETIVT